MQSSRRTLLAGAAAMVALPFPRWARAEPDEAALGQAGRYPIGNWTNWYANPYRVGSWSAMNKVVGLRTRNVPAGSFNWLLHPASAAVAAKAIRWRFRNVDYTLDDYLERQRVTGLMILKRDEIVAERYRYGRTAEARFLSFSMAKSVTSLLVGIALGKGLISSLEDTADTYARDMSGSAYGQTRIVDLLRMSSGLTFTERYDGNDDVARMSRAAQSGDPTMLSMLHSISQRHSPPGAKFVYASGETEVLGRVLAGAAGRTVSQITAEWLWQPMGAENDASWVLAHDGQERTSGYFNATLRDWARLGQLVAQGGRVEDRQIVPGKYLLDATIAARQPPAFMPRKATPYFGYGYQFWLFPMAQRTVAFQGVHGQAVFVQPDSGIVMVQTAVNQGASGQQDPQPGLERDAFWRGVLTSLGGSAE